MQVRTLASSSPRGFLLFATVELGLAWAVVVRSSVLEGGIAFQKRLDIYKEAPPQVRRPPKHPAGHPVFHHRGRTPVLSEQLYRPPS